MASDSDKESETAQFNEYDYTIQMEVANCSSRSYTNNENNLESYMELHRWSADGSWFEDSADLLVQLRDRVYQMHSIMLFGKTEQDCNSSNKKVDVPVIGDTGVQGKCGELEDELDEKNLKSSNFNDSVPESGDLNRQLEVEENTPPKVNNVCSDNQHDCIIEPPTDFVDGVRTLCLDTSTNTSINEGNTTIPMCIDSENEGDPISCNTDTSAEFIVDCLDDRKDIPKNTAYEYDSYNSNSGELTRHAASGERKYDTELLEQDASDNRDICGPLYKLNQQRIILPSELESTSFELYANYVYNGCPANITCTDSLNTENNSDFRGAMGDGSERLSLGQVVGLFKVTCTMGCHYLVERLSKLIKPRLEVHLAVDLWSYGVRNTSLCVSSSDSLPGSHMTEFCRQYLLRNATEALQLDACLDLDACHLVTLLDDNRLNATEIAVARFALTWAEHRQQNTEQQDPTSAHQSEMAINGYNSIQSGYPQRVADDPIEMDAGREMLLGCPRYEVMRISEVTKYVYQHPTVKSSMTLRKLLERHWLESKVREATLFNGMMQLVPSQLIKIRPRVSPHQIFIIGGWHSGRPARELDCYDAMASEWYRIVSPGVSTSSLQKLVHRRSVSRRRTVEQSSDSTSGSEDNEVSEGEVSVPRQRRRITPVLGSEVTGDQTAEQDGHVDSISQSITPLSYINRQTRSSERTIQPICFDITARAYHGSTECNGYMYLIGGTADGREQLRTVSRVSILGYSPDNPDEDGEKWDGRIKEEFVTSMQEKRCYVGAVTCKRKVYAIGGFDGITRLSSVEYFEEKEVPHTRRTSAIRAPDKWIGLWKSVASMHRGRSDAGVECLDDVIYVVGGFNGYDCLGDMECYRPETDQWTLLSQLSQVRSGVSMVAQDGQLYVVGGFNGVERMDSLERYDVANNYWKTLSPMAIRRSNFAMVSMDNYIYIIGGFDGDSTTNVCEQYDVIEDKWRFIPPLSTGKSASSACLVRDINSPESYSYYGHEISRDRRRRQYLHNLQDVSRQRQRYPGTLAPEVQHADPTSVASSVGASVANNNNNNNNNDIIVRPTLPGRMLDVVRSVFTRE